MRTMIVVAGLAAGLALAACSEGRPDTAGRPDRAATSPPTSTAASCVETYSPEALADRAFAFDGTIAAVQLRADPKAPADEGEIPLVTFDVHEWYRGGSGSTVDVWMPGADTLTSVGSAEGEVGARLLVAGEPRWGGDPLEDPIAWECGFTQPWSKDAAKEWEAATA